MHFHAAIGGHLQGLIESLEGQIVNLANTKAAIETAWESRDYDSLVNLGVISKATRDRLKIL